MRGWAAQGVEAGDASGPAATAERDEAEGREQQVLAEVLAGKTSREIGEQLGLSGRTVEFHRANLMTKLDAPGLQELMATVRRRGWTRMLQLAAAAGGPKGAEKISG